jgi:transcriptional antiterminator RfaH
MSLLHDKWYALRVRANHETAVERGLAQRGYTAFVPTMKWRRQWSDRIKIIHKPMFTGYVFCKYDETCTERMVDLPAVHHIVGFGGAPMPVDDQELSSIRILANTDHQLECWDDIRNGERVTISSGALQGVEGTFIEGKDRTWVVVGVTLLQRAVSVIVPRDAVVPMAAGRGDA